MRWITLTHTQRWHVSHGTVGIGHVYQGRFKSFPVQSNEHYLTVLRYIESNPMRAEIVKKSQEWRWSRLVNVLPNETDLSKLQNAVNRGCPLGNEKWVATTAKQCGLESSLKPRGRPKLPPEQKVKRTGKIKKKAGRRPKNST